MSRGAQAGWIGVFALLGVGCAGVDSRYDDALQATRDALTERAGVVIPARAAVDEPEVTAALDTLLEGELTEANAVRLGVLNNRDVRAAYERLGIAAADLVQAGLLRNPVFDGHALFMFEGGTEIEIGLAQPFLDLFWLPLRRRAAEHEFRASVAMFTHELVHFVFGVRREFVRARAAQQLVVTRQRALTAAVASHDLMRELFGAGNVPPQRLTAERIGEARARVELADAERAASEAREPLNRLLGLFGRHVAWRIGGELQPSAIAGVELEDVESRSIERSLDLLENRARIDAAAQRAGLVSWERWLPGSQIGIAAMREPGDEWGLGPSLHLELPVFDAGTARTAAAASILRSHMHRHVQIAVEVRAAARLLRDRLEHLDRRVRYLRDELLPAQSRLLFETLQNYNAMQIGVFEVLAQKQQQLASEREYLTTLRDAWLARLDLDELLAGSMPSDAMTTFWPAASGAAPMPDSGGH